MLQTPRLGSGNSVKSQSCRVVMSHMDVLMMFCQVLTKDTDSILLALGIARDCDANCRRAPCAYLTA